MKSAILVVLLACMTVCAPSLAQLSPEEAYQRLQEREKQRAAEAAAAAASQPTQSAHHDALAVGVTLHDAWTALMGHNYAKAKDGFDKVVKFDMSHPTAGGRSVALEGRGICWYELREDKQAGKDLEDANKLHHPVDETADWASKQTEVKTSRQLVIAIAAAALANGNPMRAAKVLQSIMEPIKDIEINPSDVLDEELENDLGTALDHSTAQARLLPLFGEADRYYMEYDKALDRQRKDGESRWGTKWIGSAVAVGKWTSFQTAEAAARQATSNFQHASRGRENAKDHWIDLHDLGLHSTAEYVKCAAEYRNAILNEAAAKKQMDRAMMRFGEVEKPPFPDRIEHDWQEPR